MRTYFISHAPDQRILANAVENILNRRGESLSILYEWDFAQDEDFIKEISDILVDADVVICLVSRDFVSSLWCVKEFVAAHRAHKLIAIFTEGCNTSKLPLADFSIELTGLEQSAQFALLQTEFDRTFDTLEPAKMEYNDIFRFIEHISIVLPLFARGDGHTAERFQRLAAIYLENSLSTNNVELIVLPQVIESREKAQTTLDENIADIVLYGKFSDDQYLSVDLVTTRGWKIDSTNEPNDLRFKPRITVLNDMVVVLKAALGELENVRHRTQLAEQCFLEAINGADPEVVFNLGLRDIFLFLGQAYEKQNKLEQAIEIYNKALHMNSNLITIYKARADCYARLANRLAGAFTIEGPRIRMHNGQPVPRDVKEFAAKAREDIKQFAELSGEGFTSIFNFEMFWHMSWFLDSQDVWADPE